MNDNDPSGELAAQYPAHVREWQRRFAAALEASGFDGVVIYAGEEQRVFRDDAVYPFVAEPYFRAWAPLTSHPGSAIRFEPGKRPRLAYFQDASFWHEPPAEPEGEWLAQFELHCVGNAAERERAIGPLSGRTAVIGPPGALPADAAGRNDPALLARLDYTRARKTAYESACIRRAADIAARGHRAAQIAYAEGASEFALDLAYCEATGQRAAELPYPSIVALDRHASVLHYQNLRHTKPGTPGAFLLDAGARCNGYASDVTRTVTRGAASMQALIDAVDAVQRSLCDALGAGVDFVALHLRAHELLAEVLREQRLIRCTAEDALARGVTRAFFPHGLGHLLGLQVHDAGGHLAGPDGSRREPPGAHPMLRLTRILEPGFVLTIEPGIYFIPSLLDGLRAEGLGDAVNWPAVEALAAFGGVRIEDDVLVTDEGSANLSRPALEAAGAW